MTAILGEHDVTVHEGVEKNCRISKTVQHPGYNGQTKHDMMLAQIKCNVCFSLLSAENILEYVPSLSSQFGLCQISLFPRLISKVKWTPR